jgi:hypothetical protein
MSNHPKHKFAFSDHNPIVMENLGTFSIMLAEAVFIMEQHADQGEYGEQDADDHFNKAVGLFYDWMKFDPRFHTVYTVIRMALEKARHDFHSPRHCEEVRAAMAAASAGARG